MDINRLIRFNTSKEGTYGIFIVGQTDHVFPVLERPWKGNDRNVSCIPDGYYICGRVDSPHFGNTFEVLDVPDRSDILFHKGNTIDDSKGCILVGSRYGFLNGKKAIHASKIGYDGFMEVLSQVDKFALQIEWACNKTIY